MPVHTPEAQPQPQPAPLPDPANQRRAPRVDLKAEIGIDDHTNFYVGFTENVSEGGLFVSTYQLLPLGTEVSLTFLLPDKHPVHVQGVVRWLRDLRDTESETPPGMGIEFVSLAPAEKERIQRYVTAIAPIFHPD